MPTARAGRRLKLRLLAERLHTLAERTVRELEQTPDADVDKLMQALQVLKMARLEAQGRRKRRRSPNQAETGHDRLSRDEAIRAALKDMRRGGVDIDRAPQEALDLVIDANLPVEKDHPALRERAEAEAIAQGRERTEVVIDANSLTSMPLPLTAVIQKESRLS